MIIVNVGILGLGTVGTGTVNVLINNLNTIRRHLGQNIHIKIKMIADKSIHIKKEKMDFLKDKNIILTENVFEVVDHDEIDIVVELIGGDLIAKEAIIKAIQNGKHVVTANKKLIAEHGNAILNLANKKKVNVLFEAAVAGGIPIIKILKESLVANNIKIIAGIINGTCNYILTRMSEESSLTFKKALKEAQQLGYSELEPTFDIEGIDTAHKISILSSLAYGIKLSFDHCYIEGINHLKKKDITYANELGYVIKLLGITRKTLDGIELRVHPTLISKDLIISDIDGVMNGIYIDTDVLGDSLYYGAGAGSLPTASAVVSDIAEIARSIINKQDRVAIPNIAFGESKQIENIKILNISEIKCKYYLRIIVTDKKGVLAKISEIFLKHNISIESIIQKGAVRNKKTEIVILTHSIVENKMNVALDELKEFDKVKKVILFRVENFNK